MRERRINRASLCTIYCEVASREHQPQQSLKLNYHTNRGQSRYYSVKLAKDTTIQAKELKTRITQVLAVERVYKFPIYGEFPFLEQKRFVHAQIQPAINGQSGGVSLVRKKVALPVLVANLAIEPGYRLATSVAPGAADVPGFGEAIAAIDV